jgi:transketolase
MVELYYVPLEELQRARRLDVPVHDRAALFANLCRINTLYMITRAGSGHIGTSFSSVDIVAWLFLNELYKAGSDASKNTYFSSKGHDVPALYSVLIGLELLPFDLIHKLRRKDGLPGHPDRKVAHLVTNTGSLGMGISKAKGFALANRLVGRTGNIFVLTGDGELQEGQFWESLISAVNMKMNEITLIIDHNKLQSDMRVANVSDLGDLAGKLMSFGWHVERCDGHDLKSFSSVLESMREVADRPKAIIADTIKGRGVSFMEHTAIPPRELYPFHSGAPDDTNYERAAAELIANANKQFRHLGQAEVRLESTSRPSRPSLQNPQHLVTAYSRELVRQAEKNERIIAFDADLVLDCGLVPFKSQFPKRFVECGIAEQDMVSQAGAAALKGLIPLVHSFACFLSTRPNEQIYNNATEGTKVIYVGSLAGLLPAGPGHSHQSVRDISALAAVPGLVLLEPCNEFQVAQALDYCLNRSDESSYLRLVSIPCDVPFVLPEAPLQSGRGIIINEGTEAVVFAYGPILLSEAYKAAMLLKEHRGITVRLVNLPWLNRIDLDWLRNTIIGMSWIFTLDNHYIHGGQGDMLLRSVAELGPGQQVHTHRIGVTDVPVCGTNDEALKAHGLDAGSLADTIAAKIQTTRG